MNKIYKFIPVMLIALSCAQVNEGALEGEKALNEINVTASILGNPDTKTYMGDTVVVGAKKVYPVLWSANDKIALITGGGNTNITISGGVGTSNGTFGGRAEDLVTPFPSTQVYPAAYPSSRAFAEVRGDTVLVGSYLPYKQDYKTGTFADNVYPMASVSVEQGTHYDFYNLCGVIQLKLKASNAGEQISALYLTGNSHEILAGGVGMKFNVITGNPYKSTKEKDGYDNEKYEVATYGSEGYERVMIDFGKQPLILKQDTVTFVNIAVIPQTFKHGFTVELIDGINGGNYTASIESEITIQRSCVKRMSGIQYNRPDPCDVANSYVYSEEGYYLMPAYSMGNRLDLGLPTSKSSDGLAAALLWTDVIDEYGNDKGAVTNIEYIPFSNGKGMLQFKVNIDPTTGLPYRGNAAIALYEKDTKKILWSWHVWMSEPIYDVVVKGYCDAGSYNCQYPDGSDYDYSAEVANGNMVIMDRNLGAISADRTQGWKTYGLYYQNGRRDPFIGGRFNGSSDRTGLTPISGGDETYIKNNIKQYEDNPFGSATEPTWVNSELAPRGWNYVDNYIDISSAIANPLDFSCGVNTGGMNSTAQWTDYTLGDNKTWLDATIKGLKSGNYPDAPPAGAHGTTGLSDGDHESYWNRTKTIMDPCPTGYSVLGSGERKIATATNSIIAMNDMSPKFYASDTEGYGVETTWTYGGETYKVWWPAAGVRTFYGKLAEVGYYGMYFYYDHISASHGGHGMAFTTSAISTTLGTITNHAASVRCVREKQLDNLTEYPLRRPAPLTVGE